MKKLSVSALALIAALAVAPVAHADTMQGWYAGAGFGADPAVLENRRALAARAFDRGVCHRLWPGPLHR